MNRLRRYRLVSCHLCNVAKKTVIPAFAGMAWVVFRFLYTSIGSTCKNTIGGTYVKVRFAPSARSRFRSALAYIRRDKPSAATRFREHPETVLRRLEDFPESGTSLPGGDYNAIPFFLKNQMRYCLDSCGMAWYIASKTTKALAANKEI